ELAEQPPRDARDLVDRTLEGVLVRLRRLPVAADLAHVLERRRARLLAGRRRLDVVERLDRPAHRVPPRSGSGRGGLDRLQLAAELLDLVAELGRVLEPELL